MHPEKKTECSKFLKPSIDNFMDKIILLAIGIAVSAIVLIAIKLICNRLFKKKSGIFIKFLNSVLTVVVVAGCIYYSLSIFEITKGISKTLMTSSALIIAIATFAAQQALGNVISGFSLSLSKTYKIGDKIKVINNSNIIAEGIVADISIRHTVIKTFDGQDAIIPNSVMDNAVILNANYTEKCGNFIEIEISYQADIDKAIDILKRLCIEHKSTLNDESTRVLVSRYTANGMILKTTIWTNTLDENFLACSDIRKLLVETYNKEGIVIPYETVTVLNK